MAADSERYIPFSQRTGLEPIPPQLEVGEVSDDFRRMITYYLSLEIRRECYASYHTTTFNEKWTRVAMDLHVLFFRRSIETFNYSPAHNEELMTRFVKLSSIGQLFDLIEFFIRDRNCSAELKSDIKRTFVIARAAYRVFDNEYVTVIGTAEQAEAFERAISAAESSGNMAARKQLIAAGVALRNADWAGSVRESIHAVEATAVRFAPGTNTLGPALKALELSGRLHGGLKTAFGALYGYSSDEEGVRHALVFNDAAQVDEADALFMLGACASFVSYLLVRAK